MPIRKLQGLKGLKGLSSLSSEEQAAFMQANANVLNQYHNLRNRDRVANILYMNQKFIDKLGLQRFNEMNDGSEGSFDLRNQFYKDKIIGKEFDNIFKNNKGFDYAKYNQLSADAKLKLMESDYLTPSEFENKWNKDLKAREQAHMNSGAGAFMPLWVSATQAPVAGQTFAGNVESGKKVAFDRNQRILEHIYNDDVDSAAKRYGSEVEKAYYSLEGLSDSQVKQAFMKAITPGSYKDQNGIPNMGISEFASHYGDGSAHSRSSEMKDFSIDDMRQVLAKKKVYDANMSPDMAATALNNEAKRYIKDHQSSVKRFGLFLKDVGISSLSYTADKVNGIYNLGLMAADKLGEKPTVFVDDRGNVMDPNKIKLVRDGKGNFIYRDEEGNFHTVHRQQIDRTTLHNMGKNFDGSDDNGILNPVYWTRAEQFGTLDENEQKQYEKLGSSPYKVAYNPNEDSDLLYESFKMMSFGLADAASQLIPFGVGALGRTLSTAGNVGRVARGLGKVLDYSGRMLTEAKVGQVAQGTAGALGIAYAYNRGAFQETLQQNLANAEETLINTARNEIYNKYNTDKEFKNGVDSMIKDRAAILKQRYLRQVQRDGGMRIADMSAVDRMLHARAQQEVLGEIVQDNIKDRKSSKEYADLQQKAINGAGDAALNTFLTESIKYGFVNTLGYRKFLYTNPAGLTRKMSSSLKGLKEITTSAGRKRLATDASKFLTRADKWKEFGKTLGAQAWGGAWTNGTDDMQVDAAERINEDSFNRYLNAYQNGEALADTYGYADGIFSYIKGLQNSMGQDTTWNSALVGGLGSIVNFTPNMANIARLATKEGREAYRNNFRREIERDENGTPLRNEDGSIKYKELGKGNDWRGQFNYFIQNGVLNNYYAKKQSERDLQSHADYVNNLLDEYDDFKDIEGLIASNIASENLEGLGDEKTIKFIKALHAINALKNLGNSSKDPATMSSVVQNAKALIDKAAQLNTIVEGKENPFSEEEIKSLLSQYYASNPSLEQSEYTSQKALYDIAQNAQKLQEASDAFDKAEVEIQKIEKNRGIAIDPEVRTKMKIQQALNNHWQERKEKMQSEIDDSSDGTIDVSATVPSVGGVRNAQSLIKVYDRQKVEIEKELEEQKKKTESLDTKYAEAIDAENEAKEKGDSDAILEAQNKQKEAKAALEESREQESYLEDLISRTVNKKTALETSLREMNVEETTKKTALAQEELDIYQSKLNELREERKKYINKNGERDRRYSLDKLEAVDKSIEDYEKNVASRKETLERNKERVLTADEIFSLDPVTRARMLKEENRDLYSREQQREIEKLEQRLLMRDADALQKIQDIALLTQRIDANQDAYSRMVKNPEAAAVAFEAQRAQAADTSYKLINQRNAETVANYINQFDEGMKGHTDVTDDAKNQFVFKTLRKLHSNLLDIIDEDSLLPQYQKQVADAKEWGKVVSDISSVISLADKNDAWKKNVLKNIDGIVENANNKNEIMSSLEKVIDDTQNSEVANDFEYILKGLENQGHQRDATTLENRKQRKQRETEEAKKKEEQKKKVEAEAKAAAEKKAVEQVPTEEGLIESSLNDVPFDFSDKEEDKGNEKKLNSQTVDEEDLHQIPDSVMDAKKLLDDNFKGAVIDMGEMYYGTADSHHKGNFMISREDDRISFSIDGKNESLRIEPNEYEVVTDEQENKKNTAFHANSMEKKDGDWYFIGNFVGDNKQSEVKVTANFDMDRATERQQEVRKAELAADGVDVGNVNIIDNGDSVQGKSETIEEQMADSTNMSSEIHSSDDTSDANVLNGIGLQNIEVNATTLSGNAMSEYMYDPLQTDGILQRKKGKNEGDSMNQYYDWMNAAGIKLQNIIDHELARIIGRNPNAKVKFMSVKPEHNATNDVAMQNHLMLVLDYDNSINKGITSIHEDSNGGVIESNGKKYLVIGTAGYGNRNASKLALYDMLWNPYISGGLNLKKQRKEFFDAHPKERFYVNEILSTEIVPTSQIPGYIVRQSEYDENPKFRSVMELLADKDRNPLNYDIQSLAWGIQEATQFMIVGTTLDKVMVPRDIMGNLGSAFVLIPASNGKMVPSYLKVLKYNEMRDGELKSRVNNLLQSVVSPNYATRLQSVIGLSNIFHFDKDGDTILLRKNRNEISLVHDGKVQKTFVLDSNFDRMQFMQAIEDMNPRINITASVLRDPMTLKEYDEAGALMTDAAILGTAGSSYSIYGLDGDGKMIKPQQIANEAPKVAGNSDFKNGDRSQVIYKHNYYREVDGEFYLNGKKVTDKKDLKQLNYNKMIIDNELSPAISKGVWDYYILSTGEHPEVIKVNRNTKEVKEASEEQAKELINKLNEEHAKEQREKEAQMSLEADKSPLLNTGDVDSGDSLTVDPNTGEMIQVDKVTNLQPEKAKESKEQPSFKRENHNRKDFVHTSMENLDNEEHKDGTQRFSDLIKDKKYMLRITKLIRKKWNDAPKKIADLEKFLREKKVEVDAIGTSEADIEAWIKTIEDCR